MTRIGAATTGCLNQKLGDKLGKERLFHPAMVLQPPDGSAERDAALVNAGADSGHKNTGPWEATKVTLMLGSAGT